MIEWSWLFAILAGVGSAGLLVWALMRILHPRWRPLPGFVSISYSWDEYIWYGPWSGSLATALTFAVAALQPIWPTVNILRYLQNLRIFVHSNDSWQSCGLSDSGDEEVGSVWKISPLITIDCHYTVLAHELAHLLRYKINSAIDPAHTRDGNDPWTVLGIYKAIDRYQELLNFDSEEMVTEEQV